ncbi:ATP--guanido phosphotransferase [[Clostridium] aminophilum]|uniref:ATP--guanido phosphotransferase n=1 Tax=[Clostridium] aminophilum TaxID=1526 RepID=UPI0026F2ABC4|nr:ATP--guanido phosphotransferase [[Clostridium] aminophilum]MDD6196787.1 ATP--guanido phosphotransferase [[Clostridium] aminophilum]
MSTWIDCVKNDPSNVVASRVRLVRNWDEYRFPSKLADEEADEMVRRLKDLFRDLPDRDGKDYDYHSFRSLKEIDRIALQERRHLNKTLVDKKTPGGIILSEDERVGLVLNADDHIRLSVLHEGAGLEECWEEADRLDDYINEKIYYAFNEKYGYMTAYPTNVGTGMKASVLLHLPSLNASQRFQGFMSDMSRFGVGVRGVYGRGKENYGDLYEIYNQKTLGVTEQEILDRVGYVAGQVADQERKIRTGTLQKHHLMMEDEAYKAYGVLKYARKLSVKEAMIFLSHVRCGTEDKLLTLSSPVSIYSIMIGVQPANLQRSAQKPLDQDELAMERARYVREKLPDLE